MSANPYHLHGDLAKGKHNSPEDGLCAMEWVSWIAGERHTDQPVCVSPILRSFCINLNDRWDDEMRQRLRPYLARCIGTANDGMDRERGFLCLDWQIRTYLPAWLELASLSREAAEVRALRPITDLPTAKAAGPVVHRARGAAAGAAAWAAARTALRLTVRELQESALDLLDRMLPKVMVNMPAPVAARAAEVCEAV